MRHRGLLLIAFPALLLVLLAAERLSTYFLGIYPSEPAIWRIWLELRPQFRIVSDHLDVLTGFSIPLQAMILIGVAIAATLALKIRKPATLFFLVNHFALLITGLAAILAAGSRVAGPGLSNRGLETAALTMGLPFTWLQLAVLATGTIGCISCHCIYLGELRQKTSLVLLRLRQLQRGF